MDEPTGRDMRPLLGALLLAIVLGGTVDLVLDAPQDWLSVHAVYELLLIASALGASGWLWKGWWRAERDNTELRRSLDANRVERDAWRQRARAALHGFERAIDSQFRTWGLTPAECDVALMLLKGRSHKQIAAVTGRSERTVRQHAATAYQKAGLGGRAELAAFFLEDLMLPEQTPRSGP